ncbi:NTE family protein RssA [Devosia equisanguinis]|uniref:NTE family protein RssA n=1 Tax=Devosia equisanguinis TaxID=2490941 RepID=A0A447IG69_9HYPH|nr:patatin-like phospholipase family protein [Devosia equisanguinis]VDS06475.1 NTE family protein RssA [Devosia equisanguinis]
MRKPKIGLALGSGAARGWAHVGVLDALVAAGIEPDIIAGTSMGALVGGVYASGRHAALRDWALSADRRIVASLVDVGFLGGGLVDGVRIAEWLGGLKIAPQIEDLKLPFAAVATDLTTGREVWLRQGKLVRAIRASISMPGIFSPVDVEGEWLVDGGLVNPVPVSLCRAMGADFIIAVNLNEDLLGRRLLPEIAVTPDAVDKTDAQKATNWLSMVKTMPTALASQAANFKLFGNGGAAPGYFDVLGNALNIMQDHITRSRLAGEPPHALILPRVVDIGLMDFHRAAEAIEEGRAATERVLPIIESKLGRTPKA